MKNTFDYSRLGLSGARTFSVLGEISATTTTFTSFTSVFTDMAGLSRLMTSGHPDLPNPAPDSGLLEFLTGFDGSILGEINIAISDAGSRYVVECLVSDVNIVAELSDGVNPVQVAAPVIDTPNPDETWAAFLTPTVLAGPWTRIRIYYRQDWGSIGAPSVDSWTLFKARITRVN
ncbi:MAG: hypothetical protein R3D44_07760 [Hyphomicrobiaceae bacterium]